MGRRQGGRTRAAPRQRTPPPGGRGGSRAVQKKKEQQLANQSIPDENAPWQTRQEGILTPASTRCRELFFRFQVEGSEKKEGEKEDRKPPSVDLRGRRKGPGRLPDCGQRRPPGRPSPPLGGGGEGEGGPVRKVGKGGPQSAASGGGRPQGEERWGLGDRRGRWPLGLCGMCVMESRTRPTGKEVVKGGYSIPLLCVTQPAAVSQPAAIWAAGGGGS